MKRRHSAMLAMLFTAAGASTAAGKPADVSLVGITVGSLGNPFFVATNNGIKSEVEKLTPSARVTAVSADYELSKQFTQIDNFIAAGAAIIMLDAADPQAIAPAIARAKAAGVTVAAFDEVAKGAALTVTSDNEAAGRMACQYIVDHLPGHKGTVVIMNGEQVSSVMARVRGCKGELAQYSGVKLLDSGQNGKNTREGGLSVGQSLLTRFPKLDAFFTINDQEAIGLSLAARQLHRTDFFITAVDGSPEIVNAIKDPSSLVRASSAQDPFGMAAKAYALAVDVRQGKALTTTVIKLMPKLVTSENVASYVGWNRAAQ